MAESIIVSFRGNNDMLMLEMTRDEEHERYHIRTYPTVDHAIARYEKLFEAFNGVQASAEMGTDYRLDPRIHIVEGEDVSVLIRDDIVEMDMFIVFAVRTAFGVLVGAGATGPAAESWHSEGIAPGLVKM